MQTRPDPADPVRLRQHPQVGERRFRRADVEVDGAGVEVPAVELGVGAALLDDEHLDAQPEQPVQGGGREIGPVHPVHRAVHGGEP